MSETLLEMHDKLRDSSQTPFVINNEGEDIDSINHPKTEAKAMLKNICRWLAVLPGSVACAMLATFLLHWVVMLIHFACRVGDTVFSDDFLYGFVTHVSPDTLENLGYALFTPMVLIVTGSKIAPKYKFQVGIAMAVFWGLLFGLSMGIGIARIIFTDWLRLNYVHLLGSFALGIAGCVIGLLHVYKKQKETVLTE